jgi:hypothetical protein
MIKTVLKQETCNISNEIHLSEAEYDLSPLTARIWFPENVKLKTFQWNLVVY